jgi:hypothetical protein
VGALGVFADEEAFNLDAGVGVLVNGSKDELVSVDDAPRYVGAVGVVGGLLVCLVGVFF